jgi:general secretion pathway protein K
MPQKLKIPMDNGSEDLRAPSRDRGFALLVVLWSLVLVGLLTTQIIASGRTALVLAGNLRAAAEARAQADGAINEAIFHLIANGADHWAADGGVHVLGSPGLPISLRIGSLAGKINPSLASTKLLAGLFEAAGAAPPQASEIAAAIIEWRTRAANKQIAQARLDEYQRAGLA